MKCPTLLKVPPAILADLPLKISGSGITMLKLNSMRTRYCGNKHSHVDINGNLWLKRSEFMQHCKAEDKKREESEGKKKGRKLKPAAVVNKFTEIISAKLTDLSPNNENLLTPV